MTRYALALGALLTAVLSAAGAPPAGVAPPSPRHVWVDAPGVGSFGGYWLPPGTPPAATVDDGPAGAVKVRCPARQESGSGTVVRAEKGGSLVLTVKHAVPDADGEYEVVAGGKVYKARRVAAADDADLAAVEVAADLSPVPVAELVAPADLPARVYGFPGGGTRVRKDGSFADAVKLRGTEYVRLAMGVIPGDSGSGVLDPDGAVCAVVAERDVNQEVGYAVPLPTVRKFLREKCGAALPERAVYRFTAEHRCPPCRQFAPRWKELADRFGGDAAFVTVECDEDQATARRFGVGTIPTVVVVRDGVESGRASGAGLTEQVLRDLLAK